MWRRDFSSRIICESPRNDESWNTLEHIWRTLLQFLSRRSLGGSHVLKMMLRRIESREHLSCEMSYEISYESQSIGSWWSMKTAVKLPSLSQWDTWAPWDRSGIPAAFQTLLEELLCYSGTGGHERSCRRLS